MTGLFVGHARCSVDLVDQVVRAALIPQELTAQRDVSQDSVDASRNTG